MIVAKGVSGAGRVAIESGSLPSTLEIAFPSGSELPGLHCRVKLSGLAGAPNGVKVEAFTATYNRQRGDYALGFRIDAAAITKVEVTDGAIPDTSVDRFPQRCVTLWVSSKAMTLDESRLEMTQGRQDKIAKIRIYPAIGKALVVDRNNPKGGRWTSTWAT